MGLGALGRFFKKVGKGALKVGGIVSDIADVPGAKELVAMIPVAGPGLAMAMNRVDQAEKMFTAPLSGKQKREWAMTQLAKDLRAAGVQEKRILGLVELALLLNKNEGVVMDVVEGGSGEEPAAKPKPKAKRAAGKKVEAENDVENDPDSSGTDSAADDPG